MLSKIKTNLKRNQEIVALIILIFITVISTSYYNYIKNRIYFDYKNTINNIYLKKTIHHLFDNLEPKFKIVTHKINVGETFDNILKDYSISKEEIIVIKEKINVRINSKIKTR